MIDWHKRQVEFWKSKLGISEYGMLWIAFLKGVIFGLIVHHFAIAAWRKTTRKKSVELVVSLTDCNKRL